MAFGVLVVLVGGGAEYAVALGVWFFVGVDAQDTVALDIGLFAGVDAQDTVALGVLVAVVGGGAKDTVAFDVGLFAEVVAQDTVAFDVRSLAFGAFAGSLCVDHDLLLGLWEIWVLPVVVTFLGFVVPFRPEADT